MQFLMLNHPVDCGICDKAGECRLQDYEFAYGQPRSRSVEPKRLGRKLHALSSRIQLDNERCILCSRCVRFTREVSRSNMLGIVERGAHSFVERIESVASPDAYSDNVIGLCPTGALLSSDFLYKSRTWFLEPVRSVCTGCARVCSVHVWRRKRQWRLRALDAAANEEIQRVTACPNPQINGPWICNKGFDLHKSLRRERALSPTIDGAPATVEEALQRTSQLLALAKRPAALVSAHASNEELDAFTAIFATDLGARLQIYAREDCLPAPGEVIEDDLLIRADKNPNSYGVRMRFGAARFDPAAAHGHDLFLVWGDWQDYATLGAVRVIHLSAFVTRCARPAEVCIAISTMFERSGTFSNFEGKPNHFEKVFDKPPLVQHAQDVFARLCA
jgi:NADH-quinone oxidoreductase subunit G